jgi:signal transduction histidine kinase
MIFRRKLLAVFALTVLLCVAAVAWITSALARSTFEKADEERTGALVAQFHREFNRRGEDVARRVETVARSEAATRMVVSLSHGAPDYGVYLNEARSIAENQQLDFLEFLDSHGTIISSAQSPAKFGYKEAFPITNVPPDAFLKQEELPDGMALGVTAVRQVSAGATSLYVIGGRRLDKGFLASLDLPSGMRAFFYQNTAPDFSPQLLIDVSGVAQQPERIAPLIRQVQQQRKESTALVHWSFNAAEDETVHAIPLTGLNEQLLGILLVGNSRQSYIELRQHIRSAALLSASAGMLLAILLSGWAAARVTRPVEQLAHAAKEVAGGNWNTQVAIPSSDELGDLAQSFNHMTRELLEQRERLMQAERVAAWRELARRLAHELKNPLFPLQLTVENLLRAQQQSPEQFDEIFRESATTLLAELANLNGIISRFSEFSRMPQPQFRPVRLNDVVQNAARTFQAQLAAPGRAPIECKLELSESIGLMAADPELLHRAVSNLILNAMDAMPQGGMLTLRTHEEGDRMYLEVSDTGTGLTTEECDRLFTPYYTSKAHGTGLGLAIVQSVVSDHGGRIAVRSRPGQGATFSIELPRNTDKLQGSDDALGKSGTPS